MTRKYYIDTCIWIDYLENRKDRFRPLGEWAFELIKKVIQEEGLIILSDVVLDELRKRKSEENIKRGLSMIPSKLLIREKTHDKDAYEAAKICEKHKIHFGDALHIAVSRRSNAVLVSRDKHFIKAWGIVDVKIPEELI